MQLWDYVLCLGDSLTYGARDEYGRGYPAELADLLLSKTSRFWICINEGVNGENSSDLLRRTYFVLAKHSPARIVVVTIGTNDTKTPIPVDVFEKNIRQISGIITAMGKRLVLGCLPPVRFNPHYPSNYTRHIHDYNNIILSIAREIDVHTVDFNDMEDYLVDGVHFANQGYTEMARRIADSILCL